MDFVDPNYQELALSPPGCDPNSSEKVSYNFKREALLPCPEDQRGPEKGILSPSPPTPPRRGTPPVPANQDPKVPDLEDILDPNKNPFIEIDSTEPHEKRCDGYKKTYICDGVLRPDGTVDGCYLCTLYFDAISSICPHL